jgi:hypothetical protein
MELEQIITDSTVETENPLVAPDTQSQPPASTTAPNPEQEEKERSFRELREHKRQLKSDLDKARQDHQKEVEFLRGKLEAYESVSLVNKEPRWEEFGGDAKAYAEALAAHKVHLQHRESEKKTSETQQRENQENEQRQAIDAQFNAQIEIAKESDPELAQAIEAITKQGVGRGIDDSVAEALKHSPYGVEILKHIGLSPVFAQQLEKLAPREQAMRLLALENMAKSRGGSLAHLRIAKSQPPAIVPPKVTGSSSGARNTSSLSKAESISDFMSGFRSKLNTKR